MMHFIFFFKWQTNDDIGFREQFWLLQASDEVARDP